MENHILVMLVPLILCVSGATGVIFNKQVDSLDEEQTSLIKAVAHHTTARVHVREKRDANVNDTNPIVNTTPFKDKKQSRAYPYWSNRNVILLLTKEGSFLQTVTSNLSISTDYGASFKQAKGVSTQFPISYFAYPPSKNGKLLFAALSESSPSKLYSTEDDGLTIRECSDIDFLPMDLQFHPLNDSWVFAYDSQTFQVHVSMDFCKSWQKVFRNANPRVYWDLYDSTVPILHAEIVDLRAGGCRHKQAKYKDGKFSVGEFDSSLGLVEEECLFVSKHYSFVQKHGHTDGGLYVSYNRQPYRKANFPKDKDVLNFQLINYDEGQVFLAASDAQGHVNLFSSNGTGHLYTLSLPNLKVLHFLRGSFLADLFEVTGMTGVYIANQEGNSVQTKITYDMGGEWSNLNAPAGSCKSSAQCSLHLHLYTTALWRRSRPMANPNAPGYIVAQGMVGADLNVSSKDFFVMISRDAGITWYQTVLNGDYTINILDQGGALVAINRTLGNGTDKLKFSNDNGKSWRDENFGHGMKYNIANMLNEPGINTSVVSIFGYLANSGWVVFKVNFTRWMGQPCGKDDYEVVSLHDMVKNHSCLLGVKVSYKRRKEDKTCYNGKDYRKEVNKNSCTCIREDYECDYGYEEKSNQKCIRSSWFSQTPDFTCPEGETYLVSKYKNQPGYRRVASDNCIGSDSSEYLSCPITKPEGLIIEALNGTEVSKGAEVSFQLFQAKGSKKSTLYTWNFGDKSSSVNFTGLDKNSFVQHSFRHEGPFKVWVTAKNSQGSANQSVSITVQDVITALLIRQPRAAMVGQTVTLMALPLLRSYQLDISNVHFVWTIGDQPQGKVTWDRQFETVFNKPKLYRGTVQAANQVSSKIVNVEIQIYGDVVTVKIEFTEAVEKFPFNTDNILQRKALEDAVQKTLASELQIAASRLEVYMNPNPQQTLVDVSILPTKSHVTASHVPSIHQLAQTLVDKVNRKGGINVSLDENDVGPDEEISMIKATIIIDAHPAANKNHAALYVCIPLAIMLIIGLTFAAWRNRGKCRARGGIQGAGQNNRTGYRVLRSQSAHDGSDEALLDEDLDDDDPMLQPAGPGPMGNDRLVLADDALQDPLGAVNGD